MARNWVQFQRGLSLPEVHERYGTEEKCHAALVAMRWPDGFVCPKCAGRAHSYYAARLPVPVQGLPRADVRARGHDFPQIDDAAPSNGTPLG